MKKSLIINGLASKTIVKIIEIPNEAPEMMTLLEFLTINGVTIASSCNGAAVCKKCVINQDVLSCQILLKDFILNNKTLNIDISYL